MVTLANGSASKFPRSLNDELANELSKRWRIACALMVMAFATILALHWQTAVATVRVWGESETFTHCFLILPICAYLVWRRWDEIKRLPPAPWAWGLLPLGLSSLLWLVANTAGVLLVEQFALVTMCQSAALALLGWRIVKTLVFPLFYLFFAIPFGTSLIPFFQDVTAQIIVPLIRLSGIPVYIEGLYLYIPTGSFEVAEACSGVRYLISTLALGFLAADIMLENRWRRILFVLLSLALPIVANGVRGYGIVMIAHLSNYEYAVGADHLIYGWIFFSFVTFCLLGLAMAMREKESATLAVPRAERPVVGPLGRLSVLAVTFVLVLSLAATGRFYQSAVAPGPSSPGAVASFAPGIALPWSTAAEGKREWRPSFRGATTETVLRFQRAERGAVDFYVAYYQSQSQGAEVINEANKPFAPQRWRPLSRQNRAERFAGRDLDVNQIILKSPGGDRVLWYWYWVGGEFTGNRYLAKLLEIKGKLLDGSGEAAFIAISTRLDVPEEQALSRFRDLLDHLAPLDRSLGQLGGS